MNNILILDVGISISEAVSRIIAEDIRYIHVDYPINTSVNLIRNSEKDYGWYNKFNKVNKREKYKS